MHDRTEWLRCAPGPKVIGKKTYTNLVEFSRSCATCKEPFSIYVTHKIANGVADSNSFGLKNCELHRRNSTRTDSVDLVTLQTVNAVMREELEGLYARDKKQFAEIQTLKARLALQGDTAPALNAASFEDALVALHSDPALTFPWGPK